MEIIIIYIFIIILSVFYIIYIKLKESKSNIKYTTLPLLISNYTENSEKIICLPKYLYKNNEVIKKAIIWKWLKENGNDLTPNEPFVELLIGRTIIKGTINYSGKLFITGQKDEIINGGSELCRLFPNYEEYKKYYKERIDTNYKQEYDTDKYRCVLEMPFIDGKKASSVKITKWNKKSGDYVLEKEIIGYHLINDCIEGVDHALKTGFIQLFKFENEYINDGELVYEIVAENLTDKIFHNSDFNQMLDSDNKVTESNNLIENGIGYLQTSKNSLINDKTNQTNLGITKKDNDRNIYHKIELIKNNIVNNTNLRENTICLLKELLIKEELRVIIYNIAIKIIESKVDDSGNKIHKENIIPQTNEETTVSPKINKYGTEEKSIYNSLIDVSNYDTKIEKNEKENKGNDILINTNYNEINYSQIVEVRPKKEILEIIRNDLFNIKRYNDPSSGTNKEKNDDAYPNNNHELRNFWLKLPRKYQNTFTSSINFSDKLIDDIYLKIINIYDSLFKENGTDILRALKLNNKRIITLEKIRDEEISQGYNNYYYNDMQYYNKILNIFYYTHRTAQIVLKLKYEFKVNIEVNFFILCDLGLEKYKEEIKSSLINLLQYIPDPDEETEIEINKLNTTRWKIYFNQIKEKKDNQKNEEELLYSIRNLISKNKKNSNLKNIYYDSSKLIFDIDIAESAYYYALYKILVKKSNASAKPIPSSLKKKLLIYENGILIEYESILASIYNLNTKRDCKKLYNDVQRLFVKERKTIDIDKTKVLVAEEEHIRIKNKLDKILSAEEQIIINKEKIHNNKLKQSNITKTIDSNLIDDIHKTLIRNIIKRGNSISEKELMEYAYQYKLPHNHLVNTINEYFYEKYEDILINEENSVFILNTEYINEITKFINND